MALSDIAAGLEVTKKQRECGIATADGTDTPLDEQLAPFAEQLPCSPEVAAALVDAYTGGCTITRAAAVGEVPKTTAAKTLYLLGEPIDPLTPTAKRIVDDWLAGELSRTEARTLAGVGDEEFALGAYIATHDRIEGAESAVAGAVSLSTDDPLSDARSDLSDLV